MFVFISATRTQVLPCSHPCFLYFFYFFTSLLCFCLFLALIILFYKIICCMQRSLSFITHLVGQAHPCVRSIRSRIWLKVSPTNLTHLIFDIRSLFLNHPPYLSKPSCVTRRPCTSKRSQPVGQNLGVAWSRRLVVRLRQLLVPNFGVNMEPACQQQCGGRL